MISTIDHDVEASCFLWLDNLLIEQGSGFATYSGDFRSGVSPNSGQLVYAAPHRQFVYDSSVSGAVVPSGVYIGNAFSPSSASARLDLNRGAVLFTGAPAGTVFAQYSYKEVNLYFSNDSAAKLLFENKYSTNPRSSPAFDSYNAADLVYPCIFIKGSAGINQINSFEKCGFTTIPIRLTVLADNPFLYRSITSLLRDRKERYMPIFNTTQMPFDMYGGISGTFDYSATASAIQADAGRMGYVRDVAISDFSEKINNDIANQVYGGFVDLKIEIGRAL